jgi:hypothetical protein
MADESEDHVYEDEQQGKNQVESDDREAVVQEVR